MRVETASGEIIALGTTETTPTIGIIDYSRRKTDDFGVTSVVERGFARRMSVRLAVPFGDVDALQRRLAGLRATAALWVADDRFESLRVRGFYKDFSLDLAVPPISYCTLTIEGLLASAPFTDTGGDPAPEGGTSSLQLLQPATVTDAALISSNVPENDYAEWSATTTYALGARVIKASTHRIYESAAGGNIGKDPAASPEWFVVGATNRWAMFDQALGSATTAASPIAVTLDVGTPNAVALLDVIASTVRVQAPGYDRTEAVSGGAVTFLDLPGVIGQVTVTIAGTGQVSVGTLLIGKLVALGITEAAPTAGITDYSRKNVDDFGEVTVVERAWAKRMTAASLIRTDAIDLVAGRIAAVRARPSLWIGGAGVDVLTIYGFFKDFAIEVGETVSKVSLTIEGLSKATPLKPADPPFTESEKDKLAGVASGATKNRLFRQVTDPASDAANAVVNGDLWVDISASPMVVKVRIGGSWQFSANYVTEGSQIGVANGATRNVVYRQNAAPASPNDGDYWVDTSVMPVVTRVRVAGAWQAAANLVTQGTDIGVANGAGTTVNLAQVSTGLAAASMRIEGNTATLLAHSGEWTDAAVTRESATSGVEIIGFIEGTGRLGLTADPGNNSLSAPMASWYRDEVANSIQVILPGGNLGQSITGHATDGTLYRINYDRHTIRWYIDGETTPRHILVHANASPLFGKAQFHFATDAAPFRAINLLPFNDARYSAIVDDKGTKPENNATVGSRRGTNMFDANNQLYSAEAIENSTLSLTNSLDAVGRVVTKLKRGTTEYGDLTLHDAVQNNRLRFTGSGGVIYASYVDSAGNPVSVDTVALAEAGVAGLAYKEAANLDTDVAEGSTYKRFAATEQVKLTGVAAGATKNRVFRQTTDPALDAAKAVVDGDIWIDISAAPQIEKARIGGSWQVAANHVTEGSHIGVENGAEKTTGKSLSLLIDRTADNIAEAATRKWAAESGADVTAGKALSVLSGRTADQISYTGVGAPSVDALKPAEAGAEKTAGKSITLMVDRVADNIAEGATRKWAGESGADVTAGKALSVLSGRTADQISYVGGGTVDALKPAEAGAEKTAGKSLSVLVDRHLDNVAETAGRKHFLAAEKSKVGTVSRNAGSTLTLISKSGFSRVEGNEAQKTGGSGGGDELVYSLERIPGNCIVQFRVTPVGLDNIATGLGEGTTWVNSSFEAAPWRFFFEGSNFRVDFNGNPQTAFAPFDGSNTVFTIQYNAFWVEFFKDDTPVARGVAGPGKNFRFVAPLANHNSIIHDVKIGAFTDRALEAAGSGRRIGDQRNLHPIAAMNMSYQWPGGISYSASSDGTATISVGAATVDIGSSSVAYNSMSVGKTGTAGTTVKYDLYFDDPGYAGGTRTLVATTDFKLRLKNDARVWVGMVDVVYPSSGTSSGTGSPGGGGGVGGDLAT